MNRGRPTTYRGIRMRSRLEADYAAHLDTEGLCTWAYEPACFAAAAGQWLPDFRLDWTDLDRTYVELKPYGLLEECKNRDHYLLLVDRIVTRMSVALESEPRVSLDLVFWKWGVGEILRISRNAGRYWHAVKSGRPEFQPGWSADLA